MATQKPRPQTQTDNPPLQCPPTNLDFFKDKGHRIMLVAVTPSVTLLLFALSSLLASGFQTEQFADVGIDSLSLLSLAWLAVVSILFRLATLFDWKKKFPNVKKEVADEIFLYCFDVPMLVMMLGASLYFYYATDSFKHPVLIGLYALIVWSASTTTKSTRTTLGTNVLGMSLPFLLMIVYPVASGRPLPGNLDWVEVLQAFAVLYVGLYFPWALDKIFAGIKWILRSMIDLLNFRNPPPVEDNNVPKGKANESEPH